MLLLSVALQASLLAVSVDGTARCPTPEEVKAPLAALLPPGGEAHRLSLSGAPDNDRRLSLALHDDGGRLLASRELDSGAPCPDRALAVAAIVAAWEFSLRDGRTALTPTAQQTVPATAAPKAWGVAVQAGAYAAVDLGGGAAGASVSVRPGAGAWLLSAGAFGSALRQVGLSPGVARVSRGLGELGAGGGFQVKAVSLEVGCQVLAGAVMVEGAGYSENSHAVAPEVGAALSLRAGFGVGRLQPWVGFKGVAWPIARPLTVGGGEGSASLPRFEGFLGVGIQVDLTPG